MKDEKSELESLAETEAKVIKIDLVFKLFNSE